MMNTELQTTKDVVIHEITRLQAWSKRHHEDCRCSVCLASFSLAISVELLERAIEEGAEAEV